MSVSSRLNTYIHVIFVASIALTCLTALGCSPGLDKEQLEAARIEGFNEGRETAALEAAEAVQNISSIEIIDTPYYTITLPESWTDTYTYTYDEGFGNPRTVAIDRCNVVTVRNKADDKVMFTVACATAKYPGIGNGLLEEEVGRTSSDPEYRLLIGRLISSNTAEEVQGYGHASAFGPNRIDEYRKYITIK